jgi:hypothetical protein
MSTTTTGNVCLDEKRQARIVDIALGKLRRGGVPRTIDLSDLRQNLLIKARAVAAMPKANTAYVGRAIRNAILYALRTATAERAINQTPMTQDERKYYSGITHLTGWSMDENGELFPTSEVVWSDPFFLLSMDALERRQADWEENRAVWPEQVSNRARHWASVLADMPIGGRLCVEVR